MLIVTGGAGFIGSNIVHALSARGADDIVVVDDLSNGHKFANLVGASVADYWDKDEMFERLLALEQPPSAILHQGACTDTTEWDGRYMMATNYQYSVDIFNYCAANGVALIYASSASVYGASERFEESDPSLEKPLNVYGYSKLMFDNYVRSRLGADGSQVVGLRYFNVYGPREAHKASMASVVHHFNEQLKTSGEVRLFEGSGGYAAGEQRRDFIYVDDVVAANLWFLDNRDLSGIFNVGTGSSASFNDLARAVIDWHAQGSIRYIEFPDDLRDSYQSFTEADISALRNSGFSHEFLAIDAGIAAYLDVIAKEK